MGTEKIAIRGVVYMIENVQNGHCYIGSTTNAPLRWQNHRAALRHQRHHSDYLQRAWNKYGEGTFSFSVLEECPGDDLIEIEQRLLDRVKPEYNMAQNVRAPTTGTHPSQATRLRISAGGKGRIPWNKGKKASDETRARMSTAQKKRSVSPETRAKMAASKRGHKVTPETRRKIGLGHKGRKLSAEHKAKVSAALMGHVGWTKGIPVSDETRAKLSLAHRGKKHTPEQRAKNSAGHMGHEVTMTARAKMSASHKGKAWTVAQREVHDARHALCKQQMEAE
jgi:group I intron endonuclease